MSTKKHLLKLVSGIASLLAATQGGVRCSAVSADNDAYDWDTVEEQVKDDDAESQERTEQKDTGMLLLKLVVTVAALTTAGVVGKAGYDEYSKSQKAMPVDENLMEPKENDLKPVVKNDTNEYNGGNIQDSVEIENNDKESNDKESSNIVIIINK